MAKITLRHPKPTLTVLLIVTAILGIGLTRVHTEFGYRVLVGDRHPTIRTLDSFIKQFGGGLPIYILWMCGPAEPCTSVFDDASLRMAEAVERRLEPLPLVRSVYSPASAPLLVPDEDGFSIRRMIEHHEISPELDHLSELAASDSFWVGRLISADATVGSILVQPLDNEPDTALAVFDSVQDALAPFEASGYEFHLVGEAPATIIGGRDLAASSRRLIPLTVVVIGITLLVLTKSWRHAAISLLTTGIGLIWTLGILGWLAWPRDGILEVLAPLILIVGVCDSIHILARFSEELRIRGSNETESKLEALIRALEDVARPCLVTTLTTAGAFLSFITSELETFVRFGVISALGVLFCLLLSFTLLPILARSAPVPPPVGSATQTLWQTSLESVARTAERRSYPILLAMTVAVFFFATGWITRLQIDNNWLESFGEQSAAVRAVRFAEAHLGPSDTLELEVSLPNSTRLEDPATLKTVERLADSLSEIDGLETATSVVDIVKRLNRLVHGDDPSFARVGESTPANAELLELIAFEGNGWLSRWVSLNRSRLRISVNAVDQSYAHRKAGMELVKRSVASTIPPEWGVRFSGEYAAALEWVDDVQGTQLRSFPAAFGIVFVVVAISLRSLRLASAAMVPTVLPVVVTMGAMGWADMNLDVGRAMIAAVLIGIAVDDSIHFLDQYQARRRIGFVPAAAVRKTLLHVGRALVTTSVALALGFLTLMASSWQTIASFGFFVAIAILGALVGTLFVLPALIFTFAREQ